jgi:hypothetical protein
MRFGMNREELKCYLVDEGISPGAYDLFGENKDNVYCIEESPSGWLVYFRERGLRDWEHLFSSEAEACEFLFNEIQRDSGARR